MKRRIVSMIVCFALILMFAAVASACVKQGEKQHNHVYSEEWISDGTRHWHVCAVEGCTEISEKTQHDFEIQVIKEATCIQKGEEKHVCKTCGYEKTVVLPLGTHSFVEYDRVDPTCTESGKVYSKCKYCNEDLYEIYQQLGHDEIYVSGKEATCTESGWYGYWDCSRCDYSTFREIPATGHNWQYLDAKTPTCTQSGHNAYKVCQNCKATDYEELPALGHDFVTVGEKVATCSEFGNTEYEHCDRCGYDTPHDSFAPIGHLLEDHDCIRCAKSLYDSNLYGYDFFATMPQGDAMQKLYDQISVAAKKFDRDVTSDMEENAVLVTIDYASLGLDAMQAGSVWKTFKDDNPIYYWMSNQIMLIGNDMEIYIDNAYRLGETRSYCNALIDEAVMELASLVYAGATVFDTALCYHDNIALAIDYAYDENNQPEDSIWAHNIIGVLEKTGAVCEGYARTFQLLLNYSDVENLLVTGESQGVGHAWNLVKLDDGKWYWCDLTFDDSSSRCYGYKHDYFVQTDENFLKNHKYAVSTGEGVDFLYDLPERSDAEFVQEELAPGSEFESNGMKFKIVGYNEVTLLEYNDPETDVIIPSSVSFNGRELKIVSLGDDGVKGIFNYSTEVPVKSVYIPSTVRNIWDSALRKLSLENIYVSPENEVYTSVDGVLYTKNLCTLIKFPSESPITKLVVPDETYHIAQYAFEKCKNLSSITIGPNVIHIGVTNWGYGYPTEKYSFTNLISGDTGRLIDALAGEKEFLIDPANTKYVKDGPAVYNADKTILYYVYDWAKEIVIPSTLKEMENFGINNLFFNCYQLENIVMEKNNAYFAVDGGLLYNGNFSVLLVVPKKIKGNITVHDGIKSIGSYKFADCINITGVTLPQSVNKIGEYTFKGCSSLSVITLNEGLTNIGKNAFENCVALKEITLPSTVSSINKNAFDGCSSLERIDFVQPSGWTAVYNEYPFYETHPIEDEDLNDPVKAKDILTKEFVSYELVRN